jgi:NAD(P)-dependent dehydrogenase (short-subunit alcohol dehydrogenase family)
MQIQNNVFIVTGGASGLGAATARMIVEAGGMVVLADVRPAKSWPPNSAAAKRAS